MLSENSSEHKKLKISRQSFLIFPLTDLKVDMHSKKHLSLLHIWPYFSNVICFGTSTTLLTAWESFCSEVVSNREQDQEGID